MRDTQTYRHRQLESALCESDLGFELLDMLAQANIDFRRLPPEELERLLAKSRSSNGNPRNRRRGLVHA